MRVLLDECLPRQLAGLLSPHEVRTVPEQRWMGAKNGELLRLAEGKFDAFVTADYRLSRQQSLPTQFAVITLQGRSNRLEDLVPLVPALLEALAIIQPGEHVRLGS